MYKYYLLLHIYFNISEGYYNFHENDIPYNSVNVDEVNVYKLQTHTALKGYISQ